LKNLLTEKTENYFNILLRYGVNKNRGCGYTSNTELQITKFGGVQ